MVKKASKIWNLVAAMTALCLFMAGTAWASVTLYAEGAYTDDNLKVYVYADVTPGAPIVSFGVKLTYDSSEVSILNLPSGTQSLERNQGVWFFGDPDGTTYDTPSAGPDVNEDTSGGPSSMVFVGGKIDSRTSAVQGVEGNRVLLGIVTFQRMNAGVVPTVGIELGKAAPYENFVELDGGLLDGTISTPESASIFERGDANGSGDITSADMFKIKSMLGSEIYVVYADCNDSGDITSADMFCVRSKL